MKDELGVLPDTVETDYTSDKITFPEKLQFSPNNGELPIINGFRPKNPCKDKQTELIMTISTANERLSEENEESLNTEDTDVENGGLTRDGMDAGNDSIDLLNEELKLMKLDKPESEETLYERGPYAGKRDGHPTQVSYSTQQIEINKVEYNPQSGQCKRKNTGSNNQAFKFDRMNDHNYYPPYSTAPIVNHAAMKNTGNMTEMKVIKNNGMSGGLVTSPQSQSSPFQYCSELINSQFMQNSMIPTTVGMESNAYIYPESMGIGSIQKKYSNVNPNQINSFPNHLQKEDLPVESFIDSGLESGPEGSPYSAPAGSPASINYNSPPQSNMSTTSAFSDDSGNVSMGSKSPHSDTSYKNIPSVDSSTGSSPPRYDISPPPPLEKNINIAAVGNGISEFQNVGNYVHRFEGQPIFTDRSNCVGISGRDGHFGPYPNMNSICYGQNRMWNSTPIVETTEDRNWNRHVPGSVDGLNELNNIQACGIQTAMFPPVNNNGYTCNQMPSNILIPTQDLSSSVKTSIPYSTSSGMRQYQSISSPASINIDGFRGLQNDYYQKNENHVGNSMSQMVPFMDDISPYIDNSELADVLDVIIKDLQPKEAKAETMPGKCFSIPGPVAPMPQIPKNKFSPVIGQNGSATPLAPCIVPNGSPLLLPFSSASSLNNGAQVLVVPSTSANVMANPTSNPSVTNGSPLMVPFSSASSPNNGAQVLLVPSTSTNAVTSHTSSLRLPAPATFIIVRSVPEALTLPPKKSPRKILPKLPAVEKSNESLSQSSKIPTGCLDEQKPIFLPQTNIIQSMNQQTVANTIQPSEDVFSRSSRLTVSCAKLLNEARRFVADISRNELIYQQLDVETYLHDAVLRADSNMIQALLERYFREGLQSMIDQKNCKQQTALYLAVAANKTRMVSLLIEYKADVNIPAQVTGSDGSSILMTYPIHLAASKGVSHLETLKQLLKAPNLNLNQVNSTGLTAMHCAILSHRKIFGKGVIDSIPTVATLLKAGADPNPQDMRSGKTPLMYAIETKDYSVVETMINLFEPGKLRHIIKSQTFDGYTCLKIIEGLKKTFDKITWSKLWHLLNNSANS